MYDAAFSTCQSIAIVSVSMIIGLHELLQANGVPSPFQLLSSSTSGLAGVDWANVVVVVDGILFLWAALFSSARMLPVGLLQLLIHSGSTLTEDQAAVAYCSVLARYTEKLQDVAAALKAFGAPPSQRIMVIHDGIAPESKAPEALRRATCVQFAHMLLLLFLSLRRGFVLCTGSTKVYGSRYP